MRAWKSLSGVLVFAAVSACGNLVDNGGFESGLTGWRPFWSRQPGAGHVFLDQRVVHSGTRAARIEHKGTGDWSFEPETRVPVQVGQAYRLPLWELVYHDCVVAQWYWGDYNNKLPSLWDKRDLFNVLYGTPPMFMFDRNLWRAQKARFAQSYRNTCPYVRAVGYAEMTDHRALTADRNVQQTTFANGITIIVNFGDTPFSTSSGETLRPGGFTVSGMPK